MATILAREAALKVAEHEVGVREQGANNRGPQVEKYQTYDSLPGTGYAWCNSFVDYCYAIVGRPLDELDRSAGVDLTLHLAANHGWVHSSPAEARLVVYTFSHIGFVKAVQNKSTIETVEGNTGSSGAVSDSKGGGDGVYDKLRSTSLVRAYIEVPGDVSDALMKKYLGDPTGQGHPAVVRPTSDEGFWAWLRWYEGRGEFAKYGPQNIIVRPKHAPDRIPAAWWAARTAWAKHNAQGKKK